MRRIIPGVKSLFSEIAEDAVSLESGIKEFVDSKRINWKFYDVLPLV